MKNQLIINGLCLFLAFLSLPSLGQNSDCDLDGILSHKQFSDYWHDGKAELTSYNLSQARYGENHNGYAVLIYVTEDFSKSKQVKLDDYKNAGKDRIPVLKLNTIKKFQTGIYPYSIMKSVFQPIDRQMHPKSLKLTFSSQEWCGHVFSQYNLNEEEYLVKNLSYFESDGDYEKQITADLLEDEIWTIIRVNPNDLPIGEIMMLPSADYIRLMHRENRAYKAMVSIQTHEDTDKQVVSIEYPELERNIEITFGKTFPHKVFGWEESYYSGFGKKRKKMTTTATLREEMKIDYWNKNKLSDLELSQKLGIE